MNTALLNPTAPRKLNGLGCGCGCGKCADEKPLSGVDSYTLLSWGFELAVVGLLCVWAYNRGKKAGQK